jgi:flagellar basal-body rod protein FlgB
MPLFDTTQLGLERAISGAAARQTALASNIANANTPNFKPKDVDFHSALQAAFASDDPSQAVAGAGYSETTQTDVMRPDGSGVDVDVESAKMAQNGLEYQALIQVARGRIDILQSAIGSK